MRDLFTRVGYYFLAGFFGSVGGITAILLYQEISCWAGHCSNVMAK